MLSDWTSAWAPVPVAERRRGREGVGRGGDGGKGGRQVFGVERDARAIPRGVPSGRDLQRRVSKASAAESRSSAADSSDGDLEATALVGRAVSLEGTKLGQNLTALFAGRFPEEDIDEMKASLSTEIEHWLGQDLLSKDQISHAMLVRTARWDTCLLVPCMILTLGLYYFVRPKRDLAVLILTKSGRVLLVSHLHYSIWGRNPHATAWTLARYILVASTVSAPLLLLFLWYRSYPGDVQKVLDWGDREAAPGMQFMRRQVRLYCLVFGLFWLVFLLWIWVHRQRGYGSRYRREFKAAAVAAAQYSMRDSGGSLVSCCCRRSRRCSLRLYFGKYPLQAELSRGLLQASTDVVTPMKHATEGDDFLDPLAGEAGTPQDPAMDDSNQEQMAMRIFPGMSVVLLVCSLIQQCCMMSSYYIEMVNMMKAKSYCAQASEPASCSPDICGQFAAHHDFRHIHFCSFVGWQNGGCYGCIPGEAFSYVGDDDPKAWADVLNHAVSFLTLVLALIATALASSYAVNSKAETSCVEMEFVQDCWNLAETPFLMKDELAAQFLDAVFREGLSTSKDRVAEVVVDRGDADGVHELEAVSFVDKDEAPNWQTFFDLGYKVVEPSVERGKPNTIYIPKQCLGFMSREKVLKAWTETPFLTLNDIIYMAIVAAVFSFVLVYWPRRLGGADHVGLGRSAPHCGADLGASENIADRFTGTVLCTLGRPLLVAVYCTVFTPILVGLRWLTFYSRQQCAVIVTNQRVFSVWYQPMNLCRFLLCCCGGGWCCSLGSALRVEVFRHAGEVFYGRMRSRRPPLLVRLCSRFPFPTGDVVMQSRYGVLKMTRMYGDVHDVYDVVSTTLSKDVNDLKLHKEQEYKDTYGDMRLPFKFGLIGGKLSVESWEDGTHLNWRSSVVDDPNNKKRVRITPKTERALFVWSFVEKGPITSGFNTYNDLVVTTDRIRLCSNAEYKSWDCKSIWCWCICWCPCIHTYCSAYHLPKKMTFLNLSHLKSFSTETAVQPPLWPVRWPCLDECCDVLTRCFKFQNLDLPSLDVCCARPASTPPRVQLWLKWMQIKARTAQPDLVLSVRPYQLTDVEVADGDTDEEAADTNEAHRAEWSPFSSGPRKPPARGDQEEVKALRLIMQLVLRRADEKRERLVWYVAGEE